MAAVKRGTSSGIVVAMVIFALVAIICIGCSIWLYQQLSLAKAAISADQQAFAETVAKQFQQNGWELKAQSPSDLGVRYTRESYEAAARKLEQAAEYEKQMKPLLGWDSLQGVRDALAKSPVQTEGSQAGESAYTTMRVLLKHYEDTHGEQKRQIADLIQESNQRDEQLRTTQKTLVETEADLTQKLNDTAGEFKVALDKLGADYQEVVGRHEQQVQEAATWRQRHQQEVEERRQEVTVLQEEVTKWRRMYEKEVAGPGAEERMVADGEVIEVWGDYKFVMLQGGRDRDVQQSETFVVYSVNPDGTSQKKALIVVGQVNEHTSLATIAHEEAYVLQGDLFVSLQRWNQFHEEPASEGGEQG